jgi:hypothetical protein
MANQNALPDDNKNLSLIGESLENPGESLGNEGDYYLNTSSGDVFEKTTEGWVNVGNIKGPKGDKGDTGEPGFPTEEQWNNLVARVDGLESRIEALEGGSA